MAKPPPITSPYTPDLGKVRAWIDRMIKQQKFVQLISAVLALISRMCELNTELTKQLANLRRKRPRSETLERLERQLSLPLDGLISTQVARPTCGGGEESKPKTSRKNRHPGRGGFPPHLQR